METLYYLIWNGEIIEENLTKDEATYLLKEYNIAYHGDVSKKIQRKKNDKRRRT